VIDISPYRPHTSDFLKFQRQKYGANIILYDIGYLFATIYKSLTTRAKIGWDLRISPEANVNEDTQVKLFLGIKNQHF
jgi:hypothetical protein